jgi:uncharacterized membrane protein
MKGVGRNRLEAFSDGVIAVIITIMVLELKVPHSPDFQALLPLWPVFMSYVLSFIYVVSTGTSSNMDVTYVRLNHLNKHEKP